MNRSVLLLLVFSLLGGAFAANGAALQVSNHSTVPQNVYPGSATQLQLTIQNSGVDTAGAVVVNYRTPGQSDFTQVSVGDIGAGSSAIASIPFTVPTQAGSGFFVVEINIAYFGDDTHTAVKNTPISIPIVVNQFQVLEVNTTSVTPQTLQPGDSVKAVLQLTNTGGVMNNVVITTPDNSSFTLSGTTQLAVGNIPTNSSKNVSVELSSSSSTAIGKYTIPLIVKYQDSLQNSINQTVFIGPVTVTEGSSQFRIYLVPITPTEVGSESKFTLTLDNVGGSVASATVDLNRTDQFIPIGPTRIYFDDIAPGESMDKTITLGVESSTAAGYYPLPITVTSNGIATQQNIGIIVNATPDIALTVDTQPQFVSPGTSGVKILAQIANTGNGPIRSVYASAGGSKELSLSGATDKFIGTLNVDDFATFQLTANIAPNVQPGTYSIPIKIEFKDAKNVLHSIDKNAEVTIYSPQEAGRLGATTGTGQPGGGFQGGGRNGIIFGLGPIPLAIVVIAILVLAYFGYKKFKGRK